MQAIKYIGGNKTVGGISGTNKSKWANAMLKDGSMLVWIPRYAYKITSGYRTGGVANEAGTIDIKFLSGTSNNFTDGTGMAEINADNITYTEDVQNEWLVHPAFTFGDESLSGIWVGKFETGFKTVDGQTKPIIKPNITTNVGYNPLTAHNKVKEMQSNENLYGISIKTVDAHGMKNVEWGATAYLAHSKYGRNGEEVSINTNSSYITGIGSDGTTSADIVLDSVSGGEYTYSGEIGILASTTENIYGVYDMSGGAGELVMAVYDPSLNFSERNRY